MAKETQKKPRWYKLVAQAYRSTAPYDKWLLPLLLLIPIGIIGIAVVIGLLADSTVVLVYAIIFAVLAAALADMYLLTRRFEKVAFKRMEGQIGASVSIAQSIRRGWKFEDEPVSIDPRGKALVFQGVGKAGVMLLAEGGNAANKQVTAAKRRLSKLVPGIPIHVVHVGTGEGQVPLNKLTKAINKPKKALNKHQREQVAARLRAIGGQRLPVPKGVDPMRARPDRKAMRGR